VVSSLARPLWVSITSIFAVSTFISTGSVVPPAPRKLSFRRSGRSSIIDFGSHCNFFMLLDVRPSDFQEAFKRERKDFPLVAGPQWWRVAKQPFARKIKLDPNIAHTGRSARLFEGRVLAACPPLRKRWLALHAKQIKNRGCTLCGHPVQTAYQESRKVGTLIVCVPPCRDGGL